MRKLVLSAFLLAAVWCFAASFVAADVVFFKGDKKPLEGKVFEKDGKKYVRTAEGEEIEFDPAEVERIVEGKGLLDIYFEKLAATDAEDIDALFELAMWCDRVGLDDKKAVLLLEILKRDPDNIRVHEYLGHVLRNGRWTVPGEEGFGEKIPNTLKKGEFVNREGKYFTVRTDTSPQFAEYAVEFLDRFCEAVIDHFAGELKIRMGREKPLVIVLADYDEYRQVFKDFVGEIIREERGGLLKPKVESYAPEPFTCFLDPSRYRLVAYRYKKGKNRTSLRENMRKLAGYGIYIFGLGGYRNLYKSPRFLCEGFAGHLSQSHLEGDSLVLDEPSERLRRRLFDLKEIRLKALYAVDPLSYYKKDMSGHSALSFAFVRFMLEGDARLRKKFIKLVKKDASGGLRPDFFRRVIGDPEQIGRRFREFVNSL